MGIIENSHVLFRIVPLLFVPDGIGVGLKINRTPGVFPMLQNMNHGAAVPSVWIFGYSVGWINAMTFLVYSGSWHLFRFQLIGNLRWTSTFHAQFKDVLHNLGGFRVNDPVLRILRVLHIAIGNIGGQRNTPFPLCLVDGTDFPAGVTGVKLVEPVLDSGEVIVDTVGIGGIEIVMR